MKFLQRAVPATNFVAGPENAYLQTSDATSRVTALTTATRSRVVSCIEKHTICMSCIAFPFDNLIAQSFSGEILQSMA